MDTYISLNNVRPYNREKMKYTCTNLTCLTYVYHKSELHTKLTREIVIENILKESLFQINVYPSNIRQKLKACLVMHNRLVGLCWQFFIYLSYPTQSIIKHELNESS